MKKIHYFLLFACLLFTSAMVAQTSPDVEPPDKTEITAPPPVTPSPDVQEKAGDSTSVDVPGNPFDPSIGADEAKRRALEWFSKLKIVLTLAAGWLLKLITKKWPSFKWGKFLPLGIFAVSFVGFGFGYGWDIPTLLSNTFSIVSALALHAVIVNPIEGKVKKAIKTE